MLKHELGEVRLIAGLGPSGPEAEIEYTVFAVLENGEGRVGSPQVMIPAMSREQAEHLHLQLSNALGFKHEKNEKVVSE